MKLVLSIAGAVALAIVGVALAGSAGTAYSYRATLAPGGEVPKPKAPVGTHDTKATTRFELVYEALQASA